MLTDGSTAPNIELLDQNGKTFSLSKQGKKKVLVYFYPKADTPGCTTQSCGLRDIADQVGQTLIVGVSPDKPERLKKFDDKYELGFTLLADTEHTVAEAFSVWKEKSMYGKKYMGIERSAFLIQDGVILNAWYKVSPADTPTNLLKALKK
ncbi:MAG: thioredoxin-dependent thiol peroxidase [Ilumatobacteraceae bacterium]